MPQYSSMNKTERERFINKNQEMAILSPILVSRATNQEIENFNKKEWPEAWEEFWSWSGPGGQAVQGQESIPWDQSIALEMDFTVQQVNKERRQNVGSIYLLHFDEKFHHAGHYLGYTQGPINKRVDQHIAGRGSPLVKAVIDQGISIRLALVLPGKTRDDERRIKKQNNTKRICPICKEDKKS